MKTKLTDFFPDLWPVLFTVSFRMQQLEKEYETLKENDPAELQKAISLIEVGVGKVAVGIIDTAVIGLQ